MSIPITLHQNTIKSLLNWGFFELKPTSISPALDAEILLSFCLKREKEYIFTYPDKKIPPKKISNFKKLIKRRQKYEPIAYIVGYKEFYGLQFKVNKSVLIPRPETEMLVDEVLDSSPFVKGRNRVRPLAKGDFFLIDIGTGSGCIPISIAKIVKNKNIKIYASDISQRALTIAKKNAKLNKVDKKITFIKGNLLKPFTKLISNSTKHGSPIIITANLPYLPKSVYKNSLPNVKSYEPKKALIAGRDGLKYYRKLFKQKLLENKNNNFYILCEIDPSQKKSIKELAAKYFPLAKIKIKKDLAGLARLAIIKCI